MILSLIHYYPAAKREVMKSSPSIRLSICLSVRLFVVLSVFLFVFKQDTLKTNGPILMEFGSVTDNDIGKIRLNFGYGPDHDLEEMLSVSRA